MPTEIEDEQQAVMKALGVLIDKMLNDESDVYFAWVLMSVNTDTGKAGFIGNGDRDAMIKLLKDAATKAEKAYGLIVQGHA